MRYTEDKVNNETLFDKLILAFSSIFLGPFRLIKSISTKIVFLPKEEIIKMIMYAFAMNTIVTANVIFDAVTSKHIDIWSNTVGIAQVTISYAVITLAYVATNLMDSIRLDFSKKIVKDERISYKDKKYIPKVKDMVDDDVSGDVYNSYENKTEDKDLRDELQNIEDYTVDEPNTDDLLSDIDSIASEFTLNNQDTYEDLLSNQSIESKDFNKKSMKEDLINNKDYIKERDNDFSSRDEMTMTSLNEIMSDDTKLELEDILSMQ